jgi:hypothetical protein
MTGHEMGRTQVYSAKLLAVVTGNHSTACPVVPLSEDRRLENDGLDQN